MLKLSIIFLWVTGVRKTYIFLIFSALLFLNNLSFANNNLMLENIDGSKFSFSSLAGKWVFINYWASWCSPCIDEITEFNKIYDSNRKDLAIFAVNFDTLTSGNQRRIASEFSIHYPSLERQSAALLSLGDISVVPVTFVFDPKGHLATTLYGGQTAKSLQDVINALEQQLTQHV